MFLEATHAADATLEGPTLGHLLELCQTMADMQLDGDLKTRGRGHKLGDLKSAFDLILSMSNDHSTRPMSKA